MHNYVLIKLKNRRYAIIHITILTIYIRHFSSALKLESDHEPTTNIHHPPHKMRYQDFNPDLLAPSRMDQLELNVPKLGIYLDPTCIEPHLHLPRNIDCQEPGLVTAVTNVMDRLSD